MANKKPNYTELYDTAFTPFRGLTSPRSTKPQERLRLEKWRRVGVACIDDETSNLFDNNGPDFDSVAAGKCCASCPLFYECIEREVLYNESKGFQAGTSARSRRTIRAAVGTNAIRALGYMHPDDETRQQFFGALSTVAGVVVLGEVPIVEALEELRGLSRSEELVTQVV